MVETEMDLCFIPFRVAIKTLPQKPHGLAKPLNRNNEGSRFAYG
jgi:hypothetical protein